MATFSCSHLVFLAPVLFSSIASSVSVARLANADVPTPFSQNITHPSPNFQISIEATAIQSDVMAEAE